jgi:hypothetical protein
MSCCELQIVIVLGIAFEMIAAPRIELFRLEAVKIQESQAVIFAR